MYEKSRPVLPDWTRWSWASADEREWWMPLFTRASAAYMHVEKLSVVEGVRPGAFLPVTPENLVQETQWAREHGLLCIPMETSAISSSYSSTLKKPIPNQPFSYRVLFLRPEYYHDTRVITNQQLGTLLGYPECCRAAFDATWGQGQMDSTWEQTVYGTMPHGPLEASTLLRWMGIRLVSHMPCHYGCDASVSIGKQMVDVGIKYGYREEMQFIRDVLQWPVEWSRLFGIAEIVTPALKISTRTDWTPTKDEFTRDGTYVKPSKTWWTYNGFSSADSMRNVHRLMIDTLIDELPIRARVLDLGCGTGELLRRLKAHRPDIRIAGVDSNRDAIADAAAPRTGVMDLTSKFWHGRIQDGQWTSWNPTVVLYNPIRLAEMSDADAQTVRDWLSVIPLHIVYAYSDVTATRTLQELCATVHLPTMLGKIKTPSVELGVISR